MDLDGVANLRRLQIDVDALVACDSRRALLRLHKLLPTKLETLHVTGINVLEAKTLFKLFVDPACHNHPDLIRIYRLASLCPLGHISIMTGIIGIPRRDFEAMK